MEQAADTSSRCRLAVVGDRHCTDYTGVADTILRFLQSRSLAPAQVTIVSGGAKGVDALARRFAEEHCDGRLLEFLPNWRDPRGVSHAARERNTRIVDACDVLLAFPHAASRGTRMTMNIARQRGKPCFRVLLRRQDWRVPTLARPRLAF